MVHLMFAVVQMEIEVETCFRISQIVQFYVSVNRRHVPLSLPVVLLTLVDQFLVLALAHVLI